MYSVWLNPKRLKNTWRLMNPKYLPTPIYNMAGESPWFLVTAKLLTSAQWSTSNQRELQDNCVPSSVPTPDTSLNLRSKTLKPLLTQSWSGVALLGLLSSKTTASCFMLFDVRSCLCHCGMMPASPVIQIWPLVATAPPQGILAHFPFVKPQLLCLHTPWLFH